ncbi:hypothetical protein V3W47_01435 [Deinococcus sp. YIM 134068]|uniref:hypothetical protein n=1 Tax=Deinococcus lichenicola TaxID=3118910 RepID=UPI002F92B486
MTQDDRTPTDSQGGLPADAGNGMSDRAGYTNDSESGMTDTPTATGNPMTSDDRNVTGQPGSGGGLASTGTTFGTGNDDKSQ